MGRLKRNPPIHLTGTEIELRDKLRIQAQQLGDPIDAVSQPNQCIRLKEEIAYEHGAACFLPGFSPKTIY